MSNFNPQFSKIGDILVHNGAIDENQLMQAIHNNKIYIPKINLNKLNPKNPKSETR